MDTQKYYHVFQDFICFLAQFSLICILVGCSQKEPVESQEIKLTIWESYNNDEHKVFVELTKPFVQQYNQKNHPKKLKLKLSRVSHHGLLPKLKMSALTNTTPDICRVDCAHVITLAYGKAILPLDSLSNFPSPLKTYCQQFIPATIESNLIETKGKDNKLTQHLYGIPDQTNCVALYWNKKIFKENATRLKAVGLDPNRPPKTWEEFIAYGKILSNPKKKQYAFGMRHTLWWLFPFFNSFGTPFIQKDTQNKTICVLNKKEGVDALNLIQSLCLKKYQVNGQELKIEGGAWEPGGINPDQGFINGLYAMIFSGPWNLKSFQEAGVDFGVGLIPAGPAGTSSTVGGTNMVLFRTCKDPVLAFQFLEFITAEDFQTQWCNRLGQIPVRKKISPALDLQQFPQMKIFYQQMQFTKKRPLLPRYDVLEQIINPEIELALKGTKTAQQALDSAVKKINQQILSLVNQ